MRGAAASWVAMRFWAAEVAAEPTYLPTNDAQIQDSTHKSEITVYLRASSGFCCVLFSFLSFFHIAPHCMPPDTSYSIFFYISNYSVSRSGQASARHITPSYAMIVTFI